MLITLTTGEPMTGERLRQILIRDGDGVLTAGVHQPGRQVCVLELDAVARGYPWSDEPCTLPDLRPLNDAGWSSDMARTDALLPVMVALWEWSAWPQAQRSRWAEVIAISTVRHLIAELPDLPLHIRDQCRTIQTLVDAEIAARVAAKDVWTARLLADDEVWAARFDWNAWNLGKWAATWAAWAAWAARGKALDDTGSRADAEDAGDAVLITACQLWMDAVTASSVIAP